jgi:uncharacterized DUF497 family protein
LSPKNLYIGCNFTVELVKMKIEFDPDKDALNREKHGMSLEVAAEMDLLQSHIAEDPRDYEGEVRFIAYGRIGERLHAMWFTRRGPIVRVIGIRKANPRERKRYDPTP